MTTKPRTLKWLQPDQVDQYDSEPSQYFYNATRLRAEAILWYKYLDTQEGIDKYGAAYDRETANVQQFIFDWFNLTEEDLR